MSERFYVNLPLVPGPFFLDGPEAHHLASVCRLRAGDEIRLFNGDGHEYPARITTAARREIALEILGIESPARELPFTLEIAAPPPKGDRCQFMIEKLTELGVSTFVPLHCQHSANHPRDAKREKLERWVIEASKQCGRNVLMKIDEMTDWEAYASRGDADELRVLAHPGRERVVVPNSESRIIRAAVGPQGGFADAEVAHAIHHGWRTLALGLRILRVETAAVVLATRLGL